MFVSSSNDLPHSVCVFVQPHTPRRSSHRLLLPESAELARYRPVCLLLTSGHGLLQFRVLIASVPPPGGEDDSDEDDEKEDADACADDDDEHGGVEFVGV